MFDEGDRPAKKPVHEIGQDLSPLSIQEIELRIGQLQAEIERLTRTHAEKIRTQAAADAFFKR